ncbi:MAG: sodium:solute symporter family protein [Luteitalea sp.]|nr:sodium:solute symporter family protein [Luteitalea sp.]
MNPQLALILGYSALLILLGVWAGRKVRTAADFFVAGRGLGPGLLSATLLAANIGAGTSVGAAGLGYRAGLSAWWWVGSAGIGSVALALWVGPRLWRIAAKHDLRTVGDYLELRYGRSVRGVVASLLWFNTLVILAAQLIALALVLEVVAGIPRLAGSVIGGLVMTTYFVAGGLFSSARVNLVQLAVLLVGLCTVLAVAVMNLGGWAAVRAPTRSLDTYWSFWHGAGAGWVLVPMLAPAFMISPGLVQKVYGARDVRAVRRGVGLNAGVLLLYAFVAALLGMVARAAAPALADPELALPTLLLHHVPVWLGSLGLAALFSAEVSTADTILFMLATSMSQDLYKGFVRPSASDAEVLRVARWAAIVGGALGVVLAASAASIIATLKIFYSVMTVCLFVPIVAGLHIRRAGTPEALAAIGAGLCAWAAFFVATDGQGVGFVQPEVVGLCASGVGLAVVLWINGPPRMRGE